MNNLGFPDTQDQHKPATGRLSQAGPILFRTSGNATPIPSLNPAADSLRTSSWNHYGDFFSEVSENCRNFPSLTSFEGADVIESWGCIRKAVKSMSRQISHPSLGCPLQHPTHGQNPHTTLSLQAHAEEALSGEDEKLQASPRRDERISQDSKSPFLTHSSFGSLVWVFNPARERSSKQGLMEVGEIHHSTDAPAAVCPRTDHGLWWWCGLARGVQLQWRSPQRPLCYPGQAEPSHIWGAQSVCS